MCKDMKNNPSFIAFRHKCFCPSGPGLRLWLLLAALWLCPQLLPAQQTRSGVHLTRTTVDEVMNYIEEHSDYTFLYNDKTVDRTRRVSVDNAAGYIRAILDAVFAGTDVRYDIRDNQIILSEKRPQAGTT